MKIPQHIDFKREPEPVELSPEAVLYRKVSAYRDYVRARKLTRHNEAMRRAGFVKLNKARAEALAAEYPDFPAVYEKREGA
ncbi:hypothetical protein [Mesorhizobium sp.]|uniref:hypothetical protein n=1 Tax=Mesorhizobium sp. TaxID=1871066 RepID=UPI000FE4D978|nr:hypothetical protein [Mesorhizobium sp.]RWI35543.1 MAG: hypothetical protein EOR14_29000 [Mesorhizobium sp.]RWJ66450.1 MAG: hypothetical protein EOR34_28970 [Mesorhizobium sp.]